MRIACIHIPQFALQCASRLDPALRGAPVVVVGGNAHGASAHAGVSAAGGRADVGGVTSVPRGGSAAVLASRPLSLLAIPTEVQHMLEALGVRTLGEFAALPAPSVQRPVEADYQAHARGESGTHLRAYVPEAPVREEILVGGNVLDRADAVRGPAAVALVARRLELRLARRRREHGSCASALRLWPCPARRRARCLPRAVRRWPRRVSRG